MKNDAQEALNQAKKYEVAALKAAMFAKQFGILIPLIVGGLVATYGSDQYQFAPYLIIGLALVIALHHKKTGATPLPMPTNKMGLYALIFIMLFFIIITLEDKIMNLKKTILTTAQEPQFSPLLSHQKKANLTDHMPA